MAAQFWLMKTEPETFSFSDLERDGKTMWDGVRNYQARNHLRAMAVDDLVLIYHSVSDKEVIGVAKVTREGYPDPTEPSGKWTVVDIVPLGRLQKPVSLEQIKNNSELAEIPLVKQGRLSVMPLSQEHFEKLLTLGQSTLQQFTQ